MLSKAQMSFFAIAGMFIIIVTAAMLMSTSRISAARFEEEAAKQAALKEDRALLEWYIDELVRTAVLESIQRSRMDQAVQISNRAEERMPLLFNSSQFAKRGAGVLREEGASLRVESLGDKLEADVQYALILQREWGQSSMSSRIVRIDYNLDRAYRFGARIIADASEGREVEGEHSFEGARFEVERQGNEITIRDYSMFVRGEPIEIIVA
jgi:hypothetical protein